MGAYWQTNFPIDKLEEIKILEEVKSFNKKFEIEITNIDEIKKFLQENYKFLKFCLDVLIKKVASKALLEKILVEYQNTSFLQIEGIEANKITFYGYNYKYREQRYRRALKYIIENIVVYGNNNENFKMDRGDLTRLIIFSEELVNISGILDSINITNKNLKLVNNCNKSFSECPDIFTILGISIKVAERLNNNLEHNNFFGENSLNIFTSEIEMKCENLFEKIYRVKYKRIEDFFSKYFSIETNPTIEELGKFDKKIFISILEKMLKVSREDVIYILKNLTLNNEKYESNIYNPKREERLYKKIFLEYGEFIYFSPIIGIEALMILKNDLYFNKVPKFIKDKSLEKEITNLSNEVGTRFEYFIKSILEEYKFKVFLNLKKYKNNEGKIFNLEENGGEVDIVAFHSEKNLCYFLECKMLNFSTDVRHFLDDQEKFFKEKNGYFYKFQKKVEYFEENNKEILEFLLKNKINKGLRIKYSLVTFYPNICKEILEDRIDNEFGIKHVDCYEFIQELKNIFFN